MTKYQINTKSKHYYKHKESFLRDLKQFNESKNLPFKTPVVNGIEIDLYLFYTLVQQGGGLSKVNQNDTWDSLMGPLRLPHPCINGSTLLRKIYGTYLEKYERAKAPAGRDDDNDLDDDPRRSRFGMPRVMFSGGTYISASGEQLKTATKTGLGGPSERLALSLLSPMPNEQDFAINVCTVFAADHSNRLPLATTPHILDFLLAHAGVYNHTSLRDTIGRSYYETRGRYPDDFWKLRAGGGGVKELADETKFMATGVDQPELLVQARAAHNTLTDCLLQDVTEEEVVEKALEQMQIQRAEDIVMEDWMVEPDDEDQLFACDFPGGASCVYTQRVLQVASIIRSLSFHEDNVHYLANNTTLIRFLLLCANCWVGSLRQYGLDTLGNVCTELVIKDPATCLISRHIVSTIQSALVSQDRARILAALEMLNKLAQNEANEETLLKSLEAKVYEDICSLLTLRDIMALVCTLECVYAVTSLGERASEMVARGRGVVHTLVSLVTVEAQSYGPRACILMRVVETVSGAQNAQASEQQPNQAVSTAQAQPAPPTPQKPPPEPAAQAPPPAPPPQPPAPAPQPSMTTIQQSHLQQRTVQENEHFALAWLRSSFEPLPPSDNSTFDAAEVYRQYVACCAKLNRKGMIAPAHFPRLVRTVFGGTVGPNTVNLSTGETQQVYVGIRSRNAPNRPNQPAGPASPILKAQLTNKTTPEKQQVATPQPQPQQPANHPHLSQALETGASNTTLIKHLLAHKVSNAPQMQVAQRQQNQQRGSAPTNVITSTSSAMEMDPEALIKCTTITPGGVASTTPAIQEKVVMSATEESIVKEEPVQIQIDEQAQLTIKTAQNKMLADLLEKKSNPPVQVVQMGNQVGNAPTIQITETGQIVQVKQDPNPVLQINDPVLQGTQGTFFIKNDQGQIIQIKNELQPSNSIIQIRNEQGQMINLKNDHMPSSLIQFRNDQGHIMHIKTEGQSLGQLLQSQVLQGQIKNEKEQIAETVVTDHSYTEPPVKKMKVEEKRETSAPEVSKSAANLYAALAASTLEDEEDLRRPRGLILAGALRAKMPPKQEVVDVMPSSVMVAGTSDNSSVIIQEPILQVQQPQMQVQQPLQVQQMQQSSMQVQQPTLQVQQPMLQVQPMDVQNMLASQGGQLILQEKPITTQQTQFVQQPMQIYTTPGTGQGGLSYITQNIPGNMMQKTIIIVQGTGGGPLTLTVNNTGGLDEATLNSVIAQATEAITQQQIMQNSGVIQSTQRVLVSQPALVNTSQSIVVKTGLAQSAPQMTQSQQPVITSQPQPHKAQLLNQQQQQISVQKPTSQLVQNNQQMIHTGSAIIQGSQQLIQGGQQIISVSNNQQIIMNTPGKVMNRVLQNQRGQTVGNVQTSSANVSTVQSDNKASVIQSGAKAQTAVRQVITRQPIMVGNTKIGDKETVTTSPVEQKPPTPKPSSTPPPANPPVGGQEDTPWICHWRGCGKTFTSAADVFAHAASSHCPTAHGGTAPCMWLDCDRVPRKTFALLNHLTDKHCSVQALKAVYNSRRHITAESEAHKSSSVGYPPNAAMQALNKHAQDMFNPRELMDENEGPVTKSIRLTAALILRNLVIYSNTGRRQLRSYESHLSAIALSNVEASRTIAQVLYDMNNI